MNVFQPFQMERWQSTYENRVAYNLSESGVHPLSVRELLALAGDHDAGDILLGYGQSNGSDTLRAEIAALYAGCTERNVVVTNGSAEANFIAMWELVRPGDRVAVIVPTYMQTYGLAQNFGAEVREIRLREEHGWQPDPDEIRRTVDDATRLLVITNPNNPTGAILNPEARAACIEAAQRSGAWILADEVYCGAELDGVETASFFGAYDRVLATGSLSKAYGLPGLRIGWLATTEALAARLWARKDYVTISPGELTDRLAAIALHPAVRSRVLERTRRYLRTGLDILEPWLHAAGVFEYRAPEAGAICYARYHLAINSSELAEKLRAEQSVLIVPGDHFGMDGYIRIGFGNEAGSLRAALERLGASLQPLLAGV